MQRPFMWSPRMASRVRHLLAPLTRLSLVTALAALLLSAGSSLRAQVDSFNSIYDTGISAGFWHRNGELRL